MKKPSLLASALSNSGATVAAAQASPPVTELAEAEQAKAPTFRQPAAKAQPSRKDTKPITVHYPATVRKQLKTLAADQERTMDDMMAEALNLLFVRYGKAEIAPRKATSQKS